MFKVLSKIFLRWKRKLLSRPKLVRGLFFCGFAGLLIWSGHWWLSQKFDIRSSFGAVQSSVMSFADPISVLRQSEGRTNILILGVGGKGHEAPDLTDSMMLLSLDLESGRMVLLSLPRDMWVPSIRAKLNSAYHYGKEKDGNSKSGFILAKAAVGEVINQPIHYAMLVDFDGFLKVIDLLGGIDVDVARSFSDDKYPIRGMENAEPESVRYEQVRFNAGLQHMNGDKALKFVRSRKAKGDEGTDLARSERQKKVLFAVKDKLLSTQVIFNKKKLWELKEAVGESLVTDIGTDLYPAFVRLAMNFKTGNLKSAYIPVYLENENEQVVFESALLINPPVSVKYDDQWVLIPRSGSFDKIYSYVQCLWGKDQKECL